MNTHPTSSDSRDPLDDALRDLGAEHLADDGFAARVAQAMPRRAPHRFLRRILLISTGTIVGTTGSYLLGYEALQTGAAVIDRHASAVLAQIPPTTLGAIFALVLVVGASLWALREQNR